MQLVQDDAAAAVVIEYRRLQHDAVDADPGAFQHVRQHGAARRAIGLAEQKLGRGRPVVGGDITHHEIAKHSRIGVDAPERQIDVGRDRFGKPRAHRIDEHQVADVEQALGVVDQRERCRRSSRRVAGHQALRSVRTQVQPHARRARSAVVEKGYRPRRCVGAVERVRDVEEGCLRRAAGQGVSGQVSSGGGVIEHRTIEHDLVMSDRADFGRIRQRRGGCGRVQGRIGEGRRRRWCRAASRSAAAAAGEQQGQ